jgi:Zn finger protein HypA/HybF involved in hydrogenase expression
MSFVPDFSSGGGQRRNDMIKKCKQCGAQLLPGESNQLCGKCRTRKSELQLEEKLQREKDKKKKR